MEYFKFKCGCQFPIVSNENGVLRIKHDQDVETVNLKCQGAWDLISNGDTVGVFQIESQLGRKLAKDLKPQNIEHLSALTAIMRPGCVSKNTKILVSQHKRGDGTSRYQSRPIWKMYKNKGYYKYIMSIDESTNTIFKNEINDIFYNGVKSIYSVKLGIDLRGGRQSNFYQLECTLDHPLLTNRGWLPLEELKNGDRILVKNHLPSQKGRTRIDGHSGFRARCLKKYQYKCIFCDWKEGSLDVNHIDGNRKTNNHPDNLHFCCPNHHRMITENKISKEEIIKNKELHKLPETSQELTWAVFLGKEYLRDEDVYDISVKGPNHNFIADNVVVHNCMEAKRDGKSVTYHYIDRKNGIEPVEYYHPALQPILKTTYGEMIYQEQALRIAKDIAGFSLQEADSLRKAIGKKLPELMAKLKTQFIDGCIKKGIVNNEQAEEIFGWIEKSQRYSFNKSHSVSYGLISYLTAYSKVHFPKVFFCSYLQWAQTNADTDSQHYELINDSKKKGIVVNTPDIRVMNRNYILHKREIYPGMTDVKGFGHSMFDKMNIKIDAAKTLLNKELHEFNWLEFLIYVGSQINANAMSVLILANGLRMFGQPRNTLLFELNAFNELSSAAVKALEKYVEENPGCLAQDDLVSLLKRIPFKKVVQKKVSDIISILEKPPHSIEDSIVDIAQNEKKLLGIAITCSEVDSKSIDNANCTCKEFHDGVNRYVILAAKIDEIKEHTISKEGNNKGKKMAFLKISDSTCGIEAVVFSEAFHQYADLLKPNNLVMLGGNRGKTKDSSLIIDKVWQLL